MNIESLAGRAPTGTIKIRGRHSRNFYKHADELLRSETAGYADMSRIDAARAALLQTASEVEA